MAFQHTGIGDTGEFGTVQLFNGCRTTVTHTRTKATDHLVDDFLYRSLIGHTAGYAFRHQFLHFLNSALEIAVLGTIFHSFKTTHSPIGLEFSSIKDDGLSRTFLCAGHQ